ncbi:hypothetical protein KIL84_002465 [Mauremys mutica]|uniref:Uncharacterized protein n=1 Tax=Mauremys mutica TaxID=74926 RepID=A0A9D3X6V3_9SAUR|nr:hypothetical protein KIL84_002465 [Mauremys mutica]
MANPSIHKSQGRPYTELGFLSLPSVDKAIRRHGPSFSLQPPGYKLPFPSDRFSHNLRIPEAGALGNSPEEPAKPARPRDIAGRGDGGVNSSPLLHAACKPFALEPTVWLGRFTSACGFQCVCFRRSWHQLCWRARLL